MSIDTEATGALDPLTTREEETVYTPTELWTDAFAAKIVCRDFDYAEQYRTQNADWRWRTANELYQGWVQQKYWEGTKIPRASIPVYVAFEQIESMLPKLMSAIFSDNPWFHAEPLGGTTPEQASRWSNLILDQLDKTRVREVVRRCLKSGLIYGNGILKLSWCLRQIERLEWIGKMKPRQQQSPDPLSGMGAKFAGFERVLDKKTVREIENKPELEYVSLMDFYIDPNCSSPQVRDGRYVIERKLVTVEALQALRGTEPYKIPNDETLLQWATFKSTTQADNTKSTEELFRLGYWLPTDDKTADPGGKRVEILEYWTKDRTVLVANRQKAIYNTPNSYGFIPYYDSFYADVLDRFYAMGVCDVVEGEQRLQQALLNGRLDELALALHRPMIKKSGMKLPVYSLRTRPGQIWEAEDPSKDIRFLDIPNITSNAYIETQGSEMRVQKTTGQSDLYSSGTQSSGGNSASRTATGIGAQVQAGGSRIQYLVENCEDTFIEPMLNDVVTLNQMFPPVGTSYEDAIAMSKVAISLRASAKMQSRMSLMQTFPLVFQTMANPALMQQMAKQGKKFNWMELMRALTEFTGYRKMADLIIDMTPEEMQQLNQPPAEAMMKMQMQKERIAGQEKITGQKLLAQAVMSREKQASQDATEDNWMLADMAKAIIPHAMGNDKDGDD